MGAIGGDATQQRTITRDVNMTPCLPPSFAFTMNGRQSSFSKVQLHVLVWTRKTRREV